ncbi:MAG: glycoside hydrolase family 43 protein [Microthrixaceae bacterium]
MATTRSSTRPLTRSAGAVALAATVLVAAGLALGVAIGPGAGADPTAAAASAATTTSTTTTSTTTTTPAAARTTSSTDSAGQRPASRGPIGPGPRSGQPVRLDVLAALLEGSPVFPGDFADPFALAEPDAVYLYATNTGLANIPVVEVPRSTADSEGRYLGDALPNLPDWTTKGSQWAPAVYARPNGTYVMYYVTPAPAADDGSEALQCISVATADNPAGPFTDDSDEPFVCPTGQGGAIDPSVFVDGSGDPWLLWKSDGDCCGLPTNLYSQPLSPDGMALMGPPNLLLTADQKWEANLVEAPSMVRNGDKVDLFYSANDWNTPNYAVGVAICESVTGPCRKPQDKPWMRTAQRYSGPGGQEFFDDQGQVWMVHHGFLPGQAGKPDAARRLYLDLLDFTGPDQAPTRAGSAAAAGSLAEWALGITLVVTTVLVLVGSWLHHRRTRRRAGPGESRGTGVGAAG